MPVYQGTSQLTSRLIGTAASSSFYLGGGRGGLTPLRTVVTQNRANSGRESGGTGRTEQISRYAFYVAQDCSDIVLSFNAWNIGGATGEETYNGFEVKECILELSTEFAPVYFSGTRSVVLQTGDVDIQSDKISASEFGLSKFSRGDLIYVKTHASVAVDTHYLPYSVAKSADGGGQSVWYDPLTTSISTFDTVGNCTFTGGTTNARSSGVRPIVLGAPLIDTPSFVCVGDSIAESVNDNAFGFSSDMIVHGLGFIQRATRDTLASSSSFKPMLNLSRSSAQSVHFSNNHRWEAFIKYARYGIDELGTNNLVPATLHPSLQSIWATMRTNGIEKIVRTHITPACTSTDSYVTEVNQTYASGFEPGGTIDTVNTFLDDSLASGDVDYILNVSSIQGVDPYKYKVDGITPNYTAYDTKHPSGRGHEFLAVDLRTLLNTLS